jgi:uncharacterized membrane protein
MSAAPGPVSAQPGLRALLPKSFGAGECGSDYAWDVSMAEQHLERRETTEGQVMLTWLVYGLHAVSALSGVLSPALVVTAFLTGWPSIVAVILNYVRRQDVRGTWLDSHFRWQIRTFWFALLWVCVALLLAATLIGIPFALVLAWATGLWVLYRIVRGIMRLMDARPMPI